MGIIDRLAFVLGYTKAAAPTYPAWMLEGVQPWTDQVSLDVTKNQLELMQKLSWVYNAVTIRAQTAAATTFNVKQRAGADEKDIDNHPFELLLEHPNPMQSRFEFLEAVFGFRALAGNAYIWLNRTNANQPPAEMWLIPPQRIRPIPDKRLYLRGYMYDPGDGGREIPLEPWEICHLKRWHPTNRYVGLSPIEALANAAQGDIAMQKWNKNYFARDNAKMPGALAFKDSINNEDWKRLKEDISREHGGTERRTMMLRGVGDGGVSWISFGMSQKDMEFLNGRQFNKEEIYAAFAPGLASILAINATEANAMAGDKTFSKLTIYPDHVAVAERFTADILTAYGENLRGEFEDVRVTDRALEIQEQDTYAKTHTIDEIRKEYYGDKPRGDERGEKLIAEISPSTSPVGKEDEPPTGPIPPQLMPRVNADGNPDNMPPEDMPRQDVTPPDAQMKADLQTWARFATKRVKDGKALREFESDEIPPALRGAIEGQLVAAKTAEDVRAIFRDALTWENYP